MTTSAIGRNALTLVALAAQHPMIRRPTAFRYHEWSVSSGAQTIAAMMAEPIARWFGAILVSVPARAMTITAPIVANSQPPPLIRTISDTEARMTATAAAMVSR